MSEKAFVVKRAGLIGFMTLISRITGLLRESVLAYFFGVSAAADAFYMAFTIPNLLRRFVAEGALTISFIPIFTKALQGPRRNARELFNQAFTYLLMLLLALTAAGVYFSPEILNAMAAGFHEEAGKFSLAVQLTRLCFPYLIFVSLAALVMGVLNSLKIFGSPAASSIFFNVGLIAGACASPWFHPPVFGLASGVLVGGALQLAVQLPDLKRSGFFPRLQFGLHPELKGLLGLMLPAAYGAAVYQINVAVMRLFASYLPTGAVSYLWYADRIFEFPMGVFAIALATAIQPTLSGYAVQKDWANFKDSLNHGLRLNFLITFPAMVGLIVLAQPIVRILLQRGEFDPAAAQATSEALRAFALGLPFLGLVRIIVPAFYSLRDSKRPVIFATLAVAVNLGLGGWWVGPLKHNGLALALSVSSFVNAVGLLGYLRWKLGPLGIRSLLRVGWQTLIASALMGFILWWPMQKTGWLFFNNPFWIQIVELFLSIFAGVVVFFAAAKSLGCSEAKEAIALLKRRFGIHRRPS